jgi:tight adherence protein C
MVANLYVIAAFAALTVALLVVFVAEMAPKQSPELTRQLAEVRRAAGNTISKEEIRRIRTERLAILLQEVGEPIAGRRRDNATVQAILAQAGFLAPNAVAVYWGARIVLLVGLAIVAALIAPLFKPEGSAVVMAALWAGALGWVMPPFYLRNRVKLRQKQVQRALPDALDMLVVCVEAGLGLNQALVRVAEEIDQVSPLLSGHLVLLNLEIRAGTAREEALRKLADRVGLQDMSSLVAMLIQTDRFGTSIANALRVQSSSLRTKRRQRAEEAAAKTAIKLVFPLVLCIFPALFVVILAPAMIQISQALTQLK